MRAKSPSRQGERRDRRRQDIVDTASRLFSEKGYENVTLRAIAEAMGYAHASLYRYFPDKSSLLSAICVETFSLLNAEFDAILVQTTDPQERLLQTSRGFAVFGLRHPQHFRVVFFGPENRNGIRAGEYIDAIGRPLFERLMSIFGACVESRGLSLKTPVLDAHTWWSTVFGVTQVLITQGKLPHLSGPEAVIERALEILWNGIETLSRREQA